jgi:N-acetylated-alpha-linked acidic dipeptidase
VVQSLKKKFKEWGWDTKIETYQVLFPSPIVRELEMTGQVYFKAGLK